MIWGVPISAVRVLSYSALHACTNISATDMTRSWSLERLSAYRSRPWRCTSPSRTLLANATSASCSAHPATSPCKLNSSSAFGQSTFLHHLHLTPPTYKSCFSLHYHFIFIGHVINNYSLLRAMPKSPRTSGLPPTPSPDSVPLTSELRLT